MKHVTIYREKDRYCSFPHIARLPNGNLGVAFRKASRFSADAARKGVATHHDPDSSIELIQSADQGKTWPLDTLKTVYKTAYGVNDPAMTVLKDGTILMRFVALNIAPTGRAHTVGSPLFSHRVEHGLVAAVVGNVVMRSEDQGKSWTELGVAEAPGLARSCSRDPIVEMPDGSLLMSVYTGGPQRSEISWVMRSFDGGKTWREPVKIMSDPAGAESSLQGTNFSETSLLHLGSGELLAIVRGDISFHTENEFLPVGGVGELYMARSYDGGLSWSPSQKTGIWGQPGSVIQLSDGALLCTYGYRRKPYGVRASLSRDQGRTWSAAREIVIRDDAPTWDIGYPFSMELETGEIFSVYYFVDDEGTRHIAGTRWNLP